MPLIWNNKEYKLVADNSNWDKLEFVVARKLHVQYNDKQKISIEIVRDEFEIYGSLEKIEIFHDNYNSTKFAHVTFKENRSAYCALLAIKQQENNNFVSIRPADAHLQPDNPVDSSSSPFYNLPDDCLLAIFKFCDFHVLAALSTVCKKLSELLRTEVFAKIPKYTSTATISTDDEVKSGLLTVARLIQCVNPPNFHLKIYRSLEWSVEWPVLSVDMKSSESKISAEMDFFKAKWLSQFDKIGKRIKSIHIHRSVYDNAKFDEATFDVTFPNVTSLSISGYALRCNIPNLSMIVGSLLKLEVISLRNGTIHWQHIISYCRTAKYCKNIIFENCFFDSEVNKKQIIDLAGTVANGNQFPLFLTFDRIQTTRSTHNNYNGYYYSTEEISYNEIKEALNDATVMKHLRVQIGREPFSD